MNALQTSRAVHQVGLSRNPSMVSKISGGRGSKATSLQYTFTDVTDIHGNEARLAQSLAMTALSSMLL